MSPSIIALLVVNLLFISQYSAACEFEGTVLSCKHNRLHHKNEMPQQICVIKLKNSKVGDIIAFKDNGKVIATGTVFQKRTVKYSKVKVIKGMSLVTNQMKAKVVPDTVDEIEVGN